MEVQDGEAVPMVASDYPIDVVVNSHAIRMRFPLSGGVCLNMLPLAKQAFGVAKTHGWSPLDAMMSACVIHGQSGLVVSQSRSVSAQSIIDGTAHMCGSEPDGQGMFSTRVPSFEALAKTYERARERMAAKEMPELSAENMDNLQQYLNAHKQGMRFLGLCNEKLEMDISSATPLHLSDSPRIKWLLGVVENSRSVFEARFPAELQPDDLQLWVSIHNGERTESDGKFGELVNGPWVQPYFPRRKMVMCTAEREAAMSACSLMALISDHAHIRKNVMTDNTGELVQHLNRLRLDAHKVHSHASPARRLNAGSIIDAGPPVALPELVAYSMYASEYAFSFGCIVLVSEINEEKRQAIAEDLGERNERVDSEDEEEGIEQDADEEDEKKLPEGEEAAEAEDRKHYRLYFDPHGDIRTASRVRKDLIHTEVHLMNPVGSFD